MLKQAKPSFFWISFPIEAPAPVLTDFFEIATIFGNEGRFLTKEIEVIAEGQLKATAERSISVEIILVIHCSDVFRKLHV